ncbi:MAG: DUF11 domain-containing protein [Caldilineaceae bacterium]|nr:DUF11 domain-containing protein [Caldilineaceae bacterium]
MREHWSVENRNHHKRDASAWQEDRHRHRKPNAALNLDDSAFLHNSAHADGGGAYGFTFANAIDTLFKENQSLTEDGGGLYAGFSLNLTGAQFISNSAVGAGGGARSLGAASAANSHFERNASTGFGGGGLSAFTTLSLTNTFFLSNSAQTRAGGAFANGVMTVVGSRFQSNVATLDEGGGLYAFSTLRLESSQFLGNKASTSGGGLFLFHDSGGASQIVNSLFARNRAGNGMGDALYLISPGASGSVDVIFTTVASPTLSSGSAIEVGAGNVSITDTIVTNHAVGVRQSGAAVVGQDYNLFSGNTANTAGNVGGSANTRVGPPAFADPAGDDYHLTAASNAVDAGVDLGVAVDFEGDARPQGGGFDMGYDESPFTAPAPLLSIRKLVSDGSPQIGDVITYTIVASNAGNGAATGAVISDTLPAGLTLVGSSVSLTPPGAGLIGPPPHLVTALAIAPGTSVTLTVQATVNVGTGGQTLTNTAQLTAAQAGTVYTDSAVVTVDQATPEEYKTFLPLIVR